MADTTGIQDISAFLSKPDEQGADTALINTADTFPATMLAAGKDIWEQRKAQSAQAEKNYNDVIKGTNFDTADVLNEDRPGIIKGIQDYIAKYTTPDGLKSFSGLAADAPAMEQRLQDENKIRWMIEGSKVDRTTRDYWQKYGGEHPDLYDQDDVNKALADFVKQPLGSRNFGGLNQKSQYNPIGDVGEYHTKIGPSSVESPTGLGNETRTIKFYDPNNIVPAMNTEFNGKKGTDAVKQYDKIRDNIKNGITQDGPVPIYSTTDNGTIDPTKLLDPKTKQLLPPIGFKPASQASNYEMWAADHIQPTFSVNQGLQGAERSLEGGGANAASGDNWATDYVGGLLNKNVAGQYKLPVRYTNAKQTLTGDDVTVYPAPAMWQDTDPENSDKKRSVVAVVEDKNGDYYKVHDTEATPNPDNPKHYQIKDLNSTLTATNKINNPWLEVILPNTTSQKERDKAALQIWTQHPDKAEEYGVPKPLGFKDNTTTTQPTTGTSGVKWKQ